MREKLIEHWLDSINERGYQAAFLQMLAGEGHTVVHSTRHMAIEFGKDVISVDSEGVPCAFQLKGNPGSRLTLTQFREMKPQLDELVEQPIRYPGIPETPHKCYLVTNGEIEEEVQRAIDDLNLGYQRRGFNKNSRLYLISRGMLLSWAVKHSSDFWPENYSVHEKLIRFYNMDGDQSLDLGLLSDGLDEILSISSGDTTGPREFERRQISASLFVTFAVKNFTQKKNHTAVASAFATLFATLVSGQARHNANGRVAINVSRAAIREGFFTAATDLAVEMSQILSQMEAKSSPGDEPLDINRAFLTGGALADNVLWRVRALSTNAMLSLCLLEAKLSGAENLLSPDAKSAAERFTRSGVTQHLIWGEGAIPQFLCLIWCWHNYDASLKGNVAEYQLLSQLTNKLLSAENGYLPTPYHSAEDAIRDQLPHQLGLEKVKISREVPPHTSYFVEGLFECFIRSNLKSYAKALWPSITKIGHHSFIPANPWEYCLWRIERGQNQTRHTPSRVQWADLQLEASRTDTPHIPESLRDDPVMLLAFIVFLPHRALPEVLRFLHFAICGTWFVPQPRPLI